MDFQKAGFKAGLEVHQRLDTRKLFCDCYADPNKHEFRESRRLHRRLYAVASELGELDPTARFEAGKARQFTYLVDDASSCLVECDEEPPHALNPAALAIALQVAQMLNMRVVDEVYTMRKQVLDGSAVSGFQRTTLVALNGVLETPEGQVPVDTLCLEEESAGIVETREEEAVYRLDRLGIPLLEIATAPSLSSPSHVKNAAEALGSLLRVTAKVQRGLGTIRQDLNVSIAGGARVEIKGAQELKLLPMLAENEALRQQRLLEVKKQLDANPVSLSTRDFVPVDVTELLASSASEFAKKNRSPSSCVLALKLKGFSGFFKRELMPQHTLGREVAGYVKQFSSAKGFLHSDEELQEKYGFSAAEVTSLRKSLECESSDLFALCFGPEALCRKALEVVFRRCQQLLQGVPNETRKAEGPVSVFLRPLPGASRMYPETDVLPIPITTELASSVQAVETAEEKKKRYLALGLNDELSSRMVRSTFFPLFEKLLSTKADASFMASTLLETSKALQREGFDTSKLKMEDWRELFALFSQGKVAKAAVPELLKHKTKNPASDFAGLVKRHHLYKFSWDQLQAAFQTLPKGLPPERLFAEFMKRFRLNAEANEVKRLLENKK